ncbi:8-oxoguanine DNA glycosylase OGG fold protein [Jiangella rhizosphaerae]|uniref:Uncharacterized protein n=1 Tax=Jiangella rhizosphaerae TaxID=2293569 RepID=A0A418KU65_9ACTN|nr:hypothetical protein [Jiangella rhizosphaerae]RIQ31206.1 hypothetical protein DY240_06515 [Jiangella rhizosphaerae]
MVRTISGTGLPAALPALVDKYRDVQPRPVRFRPPNWTAVLYRVQPQLDVTALLRSRLYTAPLAGSKAKDRTVTFASVRSACRAMDVGNQREVLQAFVLTMAWASAGAVNPTLRATAGALADPDRAHRVLGDSVRRLRAAEALHDGALEANHRAWSLRGAGQSPASCWWAAAGYVPGRNWQPLVLDERVYATLNRTLQIGGTARLASSRSRAARYRAYVDAVHRWAVELRLEGRDVDAERIVFVLGLHDGGSTPPG